MSSDPLAQATLLRETLDAAPDTRTLLPLLEPLLEALRAREGLLPWIVAVDPADRPGFRESFESGFEEWWAGNPRKVGKRKARAAAWSAARRRNWPGWQAVIAARDAQMETPRWRGGVIPDPATWFNGDRWEDDVSTMTAIGGNGNGHHRASDTPPEGLLYTAGERQCWSRLARWERDMLLDNIRAEMPRRRRLQSEGEEYWTP